MKNIILIIMLMFLKIIIAAPSVDIVGKKMSADGQQPTLSKTISTNDDYVTITPSKPGDVFCIYSIEGELIRKVFIDNDKRISTLGLENKTYYYIISENLQLKLIVN